MGLVVVDNIGGFRIGECTLGASPGAPLGGRHRTTAIKTRKARKRNEREREKERGRERERTDITDRGGDAQAPRGREGEQCES